MKQKNKFIYGLISFLLLTQINATYLYGMGEDGKKAGEKESGKVSSQHQVIPYVGDSTMTHELLPPPGSTVVPPNDFFSIDNTSSGNPEDGSIIRYSLQFPSTHAVHGETLSLYHTVEQSLGIIDPSKMKRSTSNSSGNNKSFDGCPYSPHAHHQMTVNDEAMIILVNTLHTRFESFSRITILDLCCGHGGPTHTLLEKLRGVNITAYITGWDIAPDQIREANTKYKPLAPDHLTFDVVDIEKMHEKTDVSPFDVVISLFGLHWMDNIATTAKSIHTLTKPEGLMMSLVPLGDSALFTYRQNFMRTGRWHHYFVDYILHNFHQDHQIYHDAFTPHFEDMTSTTPGTTQIMDQTFTYKNEQLRSFLASWIPELRQMKVHLVSQDVSEVEIKSLQKEYVRKLTDYILSDLHHKKMEGSIKSTDTLFSIDRETIQFNGLFYAFYGTPHRVDF